MGSSFGVVLLAAAVLRVVVLLPAALLAVVVVSSFWLASALEATPPVRIARMVAAFFSNCSVVKVTWMLMAISVLWFV